MVIRPEKIRHGCRTFRPRCRTCDTGARSGTSTGTDGGTGTKAGSSAGHSSVGHGGIGRNAGSA